MKNLEFFFLRRTTPLSLIHTYEVFMKIMTQIYTKNNRI